VGADENSWIIKRQNISTIRRNVSEIVPVIKEYALRRIWV